MNLKPLAHAPFRALLAVVVWYALSCFEVIDHVLQLVTGWARHASTTLANLMAVLEVHAAGLVDDLRRIVTDLRA